jgi:L-alanine-DL-glutamate epimerase-like enolase superfamily enzyme
MKNHLHFVAIDRLETFTYKIPTETPESDGTHEWDHTNVLVVIADASEQWGLGYTYAGQAAADVVQHEFAETLSGMNALSPEAAYMAMWKKIRNMGRPGVCSMAISAVDCALWDLKARLLGIPLVTLLGQVRPAVPVYGSGGFTSYTDRQLSHQLSGWAKEGINAVKMKIGRDPCRDKERVRVAREAIGSDTKLYADANGAYSPRQALDQAEMLASADVSWYEEPVSSDDFNQLRYVREHAPRRMRIATGEYGYEPFYFERLLNCGAVDVLQADITRCGGVTAFMQVAALCQAHNTPLSGHTAPAMHAHPACAAVPFSEQEYFFDHIRVERMLFDGVPRLEGGAIHPDLSRAGNGLELRKRDAEKYAA